MYKPDTRLESIPIIQRNDEERNKINLLQQEKMEQDRQRLNSYLAMTPSNSMFNYTIPNPIRQPSNIYQKLRLNN